MVPKFKVGEKVKIVTKEPLFKKYARETGEIMDSDYMKVEDILGIAEGLPAGTHLVIYQVRRDKNGFLVSIPESSLVASKKKK